MQGEARDAPAVLWRSMDQHVQIAGDTCPSTSISSPGI